MNLWTIRANLILAGVLLGLGLAMPCMTIIPSMGSYTPFIEIISPGTLESTSYSILQGIVLLFRAGGASYIFIAVVLLLFSVFFPVFKLMVYWHGAECAAKGQCAGSTLRLVDKLSKFSMIDVFVIAVLVLAIKGLPGDSQVDVELGLVAFFLSIMITFLVSIMLSRHVHGPKVEGKPEDEPREVPDPEPQ